jgi:hypothetical protein
LNINRNREEVDTQDSISRADLAAALATAAERQARAPADEHIPITEAERIAAEVGIAEAEFRAAVRALRSTRTPESGVLGPHSVLSAESSLPHDISMAQAAHMLAQAQFVLPGASGTIENPAAGLWRLSHSRDSLLQVTTANGETTMAVAVNRRLTKIGLLAGGTLLGLFVGTMVVGTILANALVIVGGYSIEALALGNVVGMLAGVVTGAWAGREAWKAAARRTQESLFTALERMRTVAEAELADARSDQQEPLSSQ